MFLEACLKNSTNDFLHDKNFVVWTLYVDPTEVFCMSSRDKLKCNKLFYGGT